jgi:hypothetical protein
MVLMLIPANCQKEEVFRLQFMFTLCYMLRLGAVMAELQNILGAAVRANGGFRNPHVK